MYDDEKKKRMRRRGRVYDDSMNKISILVMYRDSLVIRTRKDYGKNNSLFLFLNSSLCIDDG